MHALERYIKDRKISVEAFAKLLGVTRNTVYRYIRGKDRPVKRIMEKIIQVTNGVITANDFHEIPSYSRSEIKNYSNLTH